MEQYAALKKKEMLTHTLRMSLEDILPNEVNEKQKEKYCGIPPK